MTKEFLREIVAIYSPSGKTKDMTNFLVKELKKYGYKSFIDKANNVIAEKGKGKTILLVSHIDTVLGEILVRVEDNKLFGRGSVDAKASYAAFVFAAKEIKNKKIVIVGCPDEEGSSEGVKFILDKYDPDFVIVGEPSGIGNLNIGYKGSIRINYELIKDNFHSSSNNLNAIETGIQFYNKLNNFITNFNKNKKLFDTVNISIEKFENKNDGLRDFLLMKLRLRTPIEFNEKELMDYIEKIKDNAKIRIIFEEKAIKVSKSNKLIREFIKAIRANGLEPKFKLKSGTCDMNILANYYKCPIVTYGPGDSSLDHTPNEHIDLDDYEKSINIVRDVLRNM